MRALVMTMISLSMTAAVIGNAYYQKKQFYPSVVYITKSNFSMAVIYIQAFVMVILMGKLMKKVFFGQLRAAEFEHLVERSWYAITETCLAFTMFRDDFSPKFVAFFTILLFLKSFHWLAEDRVDYMERSPVIGALFHVRVLSLLLMLGALDVLFIMHAYQSNVTKGASVQLVFGFEYAILLIMIINISIKYFLHAVDSHWETPWENKAVVLLYTELIVGFLKVVLYLAFMAVMIQKYSLPLFAFRPMYYTMRNFKKAFNDVVLSRRAIRNMNTLYPDATREELAAGDIVCIICREEMNSGAKKLPCNHIFHASCLRSWFQRQQTCPTCRLNILQGSTQGQGAAPAAPNQPPPAAPQPPPAGGPQPAQQNMPMPPPFPGMPNPMRFEATMPNAATFAGPNMPNMFMSPFMAFPWPPPPMPVNLATLTPEELARMEGRGRQHIEARIQCLQNIQTMLDASVMMMQQYTSIANNYINNPEPNNVSTQTSEEDIKTETNPPPTEPKENSSDVSVNISVMDKPGTSGLSNNISNKDSSTAFIAKESNSSIETSKSSPVESSKADSIVTTESESSKDVSVKSEVENGEVLSSSPKNESESSDASNVETRPSGENSADELRRRRLEKLERR